LSSHKGDAALPPERGYRARHAPGPAPDSALQRSGKRYWQVLGPGLITGASDDDPSGIGTYSQVGAQFGFGMLWTMLFSFPLMVCVQLICARIGRVTGEGISGNLRRHYSARVLFPIVVLLLVANTINIAADLGAMGSALQLLVGGPAIAYTVFFAIVSLVLQVFVPYHRYVFVLKWLSMALLAYVAAAFSVTIPWREVAMRTLLPELSFKSEYITAVVAIFGTTISPYLFFWQASQEVEDQEAAPNEEPLITAPMQARAQFARISVDTYIGMGASNVVAFFIILTTAVTLHSHGVSNIATAAQAATALRPIAGKFAFSLFSLGIIGTGLLAVPVLAGSAAYGVAEAMRWRFGMERNLAQATKFYAIIAAAVLIGLTMNFIGVDPIQALFWTAVINGVVAVPLLVVIMLMASRRRVMRQFVIPGYLKWGGWVTVVFMTASALAMFALWPHR
jgi:NRAMP (natural resistance-associated macrophage protein)-like metal ion transporter